MNFFFSPTNIFRFSLVLSLLANACSDAKDPSPPPSPPIAVHDDRLTGVVESERSKQTLVGFAMATARADGQITSAASGSAELSPRRAFETTDRSPIGSVTKTFTAVVVHQLVEEGKLSLDATVDGFLPQQPRGERIRIRHLLSHTSGIPDYVEPVLTTPALVARAGSPWTPEELVAIANRLPALGEPGKVTAYSSTNHLILGLIIERVTGATWAENVRRRVIDRIGLTRTAYAPSEGVAHGYVRDGASDPKDVFGAMHPSLGWAAGGMVSSAEDLARYARALFDGKLVSPASLALMMQPVGQESRGGLVLEYGLGLMRTTVDGTTIVGHQGDLLGYVAFIGMSGGNVVAAASNTDGADVVSPSLTVLRGM